MPTKGRPRYAPPQPAIYTSNSASEEWRYHRNWRATMFVVGWAGGMAFTVILAMAFGGN